MTWGNDVIKMDELTITKFTAFCESLLELKAKKDELEEKVSEVNTEIKLKETQILEYMKEAGMPNFRGKFGLVSIKTTKSISQPKTPEAKAEFFAYLQAQGLFEDMVSVNSRTLSSWASKEIEAKEKEGIFNWTPPGLTPANEYQSLSWRAK